METIDPFHLSFGESIWILNKNTGIIAYLALMVCEFASLILSLVILSFDVMRFAVLHLTFVLLVIAYQDPGVGG